MNFFFQNTAFPDISSYLQLGVLNMLHPAPTVFHVKSTHHLLNFWFDKDQEVVHKYNACRDRKNQEVELQIKFSYGKQGLQQNRFSIVKYLFWGPFLMNWTWGVKIHFIKTNFLLVLQERNTYYRCTMLQIFIWLMVFSLTQNVPSMESRSKLNTLWVASS